MKAQNHEIISMQESVKVRRQRAVKEFERQNIRRAARQAKRFIQESAWSLGGLRHTY